MSLPPGRHVIYTQHARFPGRCWSDFDIRRQNRDLLSRQDGHPRLFQNPTHAARAHGLLPW